MAEDMTDDFTKVMDMVEEQFPKIKWIISAINFDDEIACSAVGRSLTTDKVDAILLIVLAMENLGVSLAELVTAIAAKPTRGNGSKENLW